MHMINMVWAGHAVTCTHTLIDWNEKWWIELICSQSHAVNDESANTIIYGYSVDQSTSKTSRPVHVCMSELRNRPQVNFPNAQCLLWLSHSVNPTSGNGIDPLQRLDLGCAETDSNKNSLVVCFATLQNRSGQCTLCTCNQALFCLEGHPLCAYACICLH